MKIDWLIPFLAAASFGSMGGLSGQTLDEVLRQGASSPPKPAAKAPMPPAKGPTGPNTRATAPVTAAGSYYRLKLVKIIDDQGFGQPVEVARLLVPADWRTEGGVRWDSQQMRCPYNIIKPYFRASAPDGLTGVEIAPGYSWQSSSDAMTRQMANGTGCDMGPVLGAIDFLRQNAAPRMRPNSRMVGAEPLPAIAQAKQALLAQTYGPLVQAGYVRGYKADSGSVRITYAVNGQPVEEWLSTNIISVAMPAANTAMLAQGQVSMSASSYVLASDGIFGARAPAGRLDKKLVATIVTSLRANPQYSAAVAQFIANMNNIARQGAMDRQRIWHEAQQQISGTITQTYQYQQAVQDRAAQQFSETIRGVESYVNPRTGERVELVGGYNNAWVNNRGEYLISDTPGFDPGVAFREDWTQLQKGR